MESFHCFLLFRITATEVESRLRKKIKGVLPCDILQPDPLGPLQNEAKFDLIVTTFCVMTACRSEAEYRSAWKRLATLLTPGGVLVTAETLEESRNEVGGATFTTVPITLELVRESLKDAGFQIINSIEGVYSGEGHHVTDSNKWHFTVATKI